MASVAAVLSRLCCDYVAVRGTCKQPAAGKCAGRAPTAGSPPNFVAPIKELEFPTSSVFTPSPTEHTFTHLALCRGSWSVSERRQMRAAATKQQSDGTAAVTESVDTLNADGGSQSTAASEAAAREVKATTELVEL